MRHVRGFLQMTMSVLTKPDEVLPGETLEASRRIYLSHVREAIINENKSLKSTRGNSAYSVRQGGKGINIAGNRVISICIVDLFGGFVGPRNGNVDKSSCIDVREVIETDVG